jgi:hypothetical protein
MFGSWNTEGLFCLGSSFYDIGKEMSYVEIEV